MKSMMMPRITWGGKQPDMSALDEVCWIDMLNGCFHLGRSPLSGHLFDDGCILHGVPHPVVGVECVKGAQVG